MDDAAGVQSLIERQIREAIENGVFDQLEGKGRPLQLDLNPFEDRNAGTLRRILRDNGVSHPVFEARKEIESALEEARAEFRRTRREGQFRRRIGELNREIRLFNLRSPLPNFHLRLVDFETEMVASRRSG